jgi:RHS repeat-associated protein
MEGAGGIGGLLARSSGYSGGTGNWSTNHYYFADGNGNITYLVDSSQTLAASYRYDPFGNTISSSGSLATANVYRFSSKEQHVASGMYYYGYRFYDPNLQRWRNRDPAAEPGFEAVRTAIPAAWRQFVPPGESLQMPNLYAPFQNSPINGADALGLFPVPCPNAWVAGCAFLCYPNLPATACDVKITWADGAVHITITMVCKCIKCPWRN